MEFRRLSALSLPAVAVAILLLVFEQSVVWAIPDQNPLQQIVQSPTPTPTPIPTPDKAFQASGASATTRVTATQGGVITSSDGRMSVSVPAGAVTEDINVTFTPLKNWTWGAPSMRVVNMFELKASTVSTGAPVSQFAQNLTITYRLPADYSRQELAGLDPNTLTLYFLNQSTGRWIALPTTRRSGAVGQGPTVTASTNHFSIYGSQASPIISGPGTVLNFQTDPYSAAAVTNVPIEVPASPNGFAPQLNLTYNSASVDEMKNKRDVGSWVGIGWSLKMGSISKNLETGKFYLDIGGASYELVQDTANTQTWYTKPQSGSLIYHIEPAAKLLIG